MERPISRLWRRCRRWYVPSFLPSFSSAMNTVMDGCSGYAVGMAVTFAALLLMNNAQPALIYLIPFTLVPTYVAALVRREFWILWRGDMPLDTSFLDVGTEEMAIKDAETDPPAYQAFHPIPANQPLQNPA